MPEMELSLNSDGEIWAQLFAYMGWPDDPLRRQAHVASCAAKGIAGIDYVISSRGPDMSPDLRALADGVKNTWNRVFYDFGGFNSLALLLDPDEPPDRFPGAAVNSVADVLLTVRSIEVRHPELRAGGSINKASWLIALGKGQRDVLLNETQIKRAWRKYRNVSHLAAAIRRLVQTRPVRYENLDYLSKINHEFDTDELVLFMLIAKDYEDFLTSFCTHGGHALADREKIWSLPERLQIPKCPNPLVPPLHEHDLALLRRYQA
jgi:hypothetical protein